MTDEVSDEQDAAIEDAGPDEHADAGVEVETHFGAPVTRSRGQLVLHPDRDTYLDTVTALRDAGHIMCLDVTAVDYLENPERDLPHGVTPERFEVVVTLISHTDRERIRLRVQVPDSDPTIASLFDIYPGSEALERETNDMFGIAFDGHPDPTRILMPEDWRGHPLRKDYGVGAIPVQFKGAPGPR